MKDKILYFFTLALAVFGIVGGVILSILYKAYVLIVCFAVLAVLAFPKAREIYYKLTSRDE